MIHPAMVVAIILLWYTVVGIAFIVWWLVGKYGIKDTTINSTTAYCSVCDDWYHTMFIHDICPVCESVIISEV